jgi:hypothetical protein
MGCVGDGRVHTDHQAFQRRKGLVGRPQNSAKGGLCPKGGAGVVHQKTLNFLKTQRAGAITFFHGLEISSRQVRGIIEGAAGGDVDFRMMEQVFQERQGTGGCGDHHPRGVSQPQAHHELIPDVLGMGELGQLIHPRSVKLGASKLFVSLGTVTGGLGPIGPQQDILRRFVKRTG